MGLGRKRDLMAQAQKTSGVYGGSGEPSPLDILFRGEYRVDTSRVTYTPQKGHHTQRAGHYEVYLPGVLARAETWSRSELVGMLDQIHVQAIEDGLVPSWHTVRSEWDEQAQHWYLCVDVLK